MDKSLVYWYFFSFIYSVSVALNKRESIKLLGAEKAWCSPGKQVPMPYHVHRYISLKRLLPPPEERSYYGFRNVY